MEEKKYQQATMNWVQSIVVGLSLCPFAKQSIIENRLSERVVLAEDPEIILAELLSEIKQLEQNLKLESSLVTIPNGPSNFQSYLDLLDQANNLLNLSGYEGIYQLASFHPSYQFAGTDANAPENYTNRSPYPVFHIIREDALTEAIDNFPNIEDVPNSNIDKMNKLGIQKLKELLIKANPHL